MASPRPIRASDSEREATTEILRRAYAEGRLDGAELEERTVRAYTARTWAELDDLIVDLPVIPEPAIEPSRWDGAAAWPLGRVCWLLIVTVGVALIFAVTRNVVAVPFVFLWLTMLHVRAGAPRMRAHPDGSLSTRRTARRTARRAKIIASRSFMYRDARYLRP